MGLTAARQRRRTASVVRRCSTEREGNMFDKQMAAFTACVGLLMILLASCASGPPPIQRLDAKPQTTQATFEETWAALSDVLSEKRLPIRAFEKESGLITTDFVNSGSRYIYWGKKDGSGAEISTWALKTRCFLNIRVRAAESGGATVDVLPHIEYMQYRYVRGVGDVEVGWAQCDSHGDIEQEIYDALAVKLNK